MAHITFIHGIANKPAKPELLRIWRDSLKQAYYPLDLGAEGISSDIVYWADVLHESPMPLDSYENEEETIVAEAKVENFEQLSSIDFTGQNDDEWTLSLAKRLGLKVEDGILTLSENLVANDELSFDLERIPLPRFVKDFFLKRFLKDVHHYLLNAEFTPRSGETYRVQNEIRSRFIQSIKKGSEKGSPHIVVSHSMGTVIAYDCLKRVTECPAIDHFVTLGSPLGIDEIQDKLQPGWTRSDGYPAGAVVHGWDNFFDKLDVVSRLDPYLADDFCSENAIVVTDTAQSNDGPWHHDITKYLKGKHVSRGIARALGFDP